MLAQIYARVKSREVQTAALLAQDASDPALRRAAWWHYLLLDHGILRTIWSNFAQVAPGVYRANQPSPARLARYRDKGIRTIVSLRAGLSSAAGIFEREACEKLGLAHVEAFGLSAVRLPSLDTINALEAVLRGAQKPFLIHCKSGSDRTGLVSALYLLLIEQSPVAEAARHLSPRFIHFRHTKSGVLDAMLDAYARDQAKSGIGFRDWLDTIYDPDAIKAAFDAKRAPSRTAPQ